MLKYLNNIKLPITLQSHKHLIPPPVRLTWQECIHEHGGSESPTPGNQVQTRSWKFCPRNVLHCNAYIHLGRTDEKERKKETEMDEAKRSKN